MRKIRYGMMIMYGASGSGTSGSGTSGSGTSSIKVEVKATKLVALIPKPRAVT